MSSTPSPPSPTGGAGAGLAPRHAVSLGLALNAVTGAVESVCFGHLGQVFAAYASGTVILAGLRLGSGGAGKLAPYAVALAGFMAGALIGGRLVHSKRSDRGRVAASLVAEAAALLAAAAVSDRMALGPGQDGRLLTLALCSMAMAIQFSATRHIGVPDLILAAATGIIHSLLHDSPVAGGRPQRTLRRLSAIVALMAGAALGAAIAAWCIPALLLILTVAVATMSATVGHGPSSRSSRARSARGDPRGRVGGRGQPRAGTSPAYRHADDVPDLPGGEVTTARKIVAAALDFKRLRFV